MPVTPASAVAEAPIVDAPFATAIIDAAEEHKNMVVLSADLSKYTDVAPFAELYPHRFIQVGMAEQNMMGIAGGLAKSGIVPVAVTYCVFATRRAGDQVQMALATGRHTAVIVAFLPGITTPFRASHQGTDDISIMRAIPGMTVIDPMDSTDMCGALKAAMSVPGPVYLRGLRGMVPEILPSTYDFKIGAVHLLRDGGDVGFIGTGLGSQWALEAADLLAQRGLRASLLHVPTIKPLDTERIACFLRHCQAVLTVENHSIIGGLGSAVAEVIAETGVNCRLHRLGIPDRWADAGPLDMLRNRFNLDKESIATIAKNYLKGH